MKAILEFDLPEENNSHILTINALNFALSLWDIDQKLRSWIKHGHGFQSADETLERCREVLHEFIDDHNISLDMIE